MGFADGGELPASHALPAPRGTAHIPDGEQRRPGRQNRTRLRIGIQKSGPSIDGPDAFCFVLVQFARYTGIEYSKPKQVTVSFVPPDLACRISQVQLLPSSLGVSFRQSGSAVDQVKEALAKTSAG